MRPTMTSLRPKISLRAGLCSHKKWAPVIFSVSFNAAIGF